MSFFFEKNRNLYYEKLNNVRVNNDIIGWIQFFLEGVIETAEIAKTKFKKVVELTKKIDNQLLDLKVTHENAKKVIDFLYNEPISSRKKIFDNLDIPISTLNGVINELKRIGILYETTGYTRNQIIVFKEYVDIFLIQD